jgi:hypothetical protein
MLMTPPSYVEIGGLLASILLPVFGFTVVATWIDARKKEREAFYQNELLKKLADTPGPQAQQVIEFMREQELQKEQRAREGLKVGGVVVAMVGIAMTVMLAVLEPSKALWGVGLVPLLTGVGLLTYAYLLAPPASAVGKK